MIYFYILQCACTLDTNAQSQLSNFLFPFFKSAPQIINPHSQLSLNIFLLPPPPLLLSLSSIITDLRGGNNWVRLMGAWGVPPLESKCSFPRLIRGTRPLPLIKYWFIVQRNARDGTVENLPNYLCERKCARQSEIKC